MRDDADQTVSFRETRERLISFAECFGVERAEAFVYEERVKVNARRHLHLVGKPERQGQGSKERFAAGEGIDAALGRVDMIDDNLM